jgi:hypothetical protein
MELDHRVLTVDFSLGSTREDEVSGIEQSQAVVEWELFCVGDGEFWVGLFWQISRLDTNYPK